jgi:hypothetical protein
MKCGIRYSTNQRVTRTPVSKINTTKVILSNEDLIQDVLNKRVNNNSKTNQSRSMRETQDLIPRFGFTKNPTSSLRGSQRTGPLSTLSPLKESPRHT